MKFAIGYQQPENGELFSDVIKDYQSGIAEVYFPWIGMASGRAALGRRHGAVDWRSQEILEYDLTRIREMGIKLNLLFNANCYGSRAVSIELENEVTSIIQHLRGIVGGPDIITTASIAIARMVKRYFPEIETRASVNMRIGSVQAMRYSVGLFDSYYVQRDIQRNLTKVIQLKEWCENNEKKLYMLANSGCLKYCPGQIFHDNMVAHDAEIDEVKNIRDWTPHVCWNLYRKPENFLEILRATWIRPEDIQNYDGIFDIVKLATRQHSHLRMVIEAYVTRKFDGNLLNLLEPSLAPIFAPYYIDNQQFPPDWFEKTSSEDDCKEECSYYENVLKQVLHKY